MRVGVTATRKGLTPQQKEKARYSIMPMDELHHGDCTGGDEDIHNLAREIGVRPPSGKIVAHPCTLSDQRAHTDADEVREPKAPIPRNHDIVDEVEKMLAFPSSRVEQMRGSGTWATMRYAAKKARRSQLARLTSSLYDQSGTGLRPGVRPAFYLVVIWPDGEEEYRWRQE